ncbi:MAG TPA: hypothetical protein VLW65_22895 [Bryobacteraceae bacterium]|nr:hypothetical protein [Bryobacteraceae bacterium]
MKLQRPGLRPIELMMLAWFGVTASHAQPGPEAPGQSLTLLSGATITVPGTWVRTQDTRSTYLVEHHKDGKTVDASMVIHVEKRRDHSEALRRLAEIDTEYAGATYVLIAGWPALERKAVVPFQYPGEQEDQGGTQPRGNETSLRVTTAVALGEFVIRAQTLLQPGANPALADQALAMVRTLAAPGMKPGRSQEELRQLQNGVFKPKFLAPQPRGGGASMPSAPVAARRRSTASGGAGSVQVNGGGEIEAAMSIDGQNLVTDASCALMYSNNGGGSFSASTVNGSGVPAGLDGDCTVAWGFSGNFYLGQLGSDFVALYQSNNSGGHNFGQTFNYLALAVDRRSAGINVDQPHVAADRWSASASSHDRVYVSWQETGSFVSRVACSSDSGATWGSPVDANSGSFGYPRVAVGQDGMVYVASRDGSNIAVDKFSNCDTGLTEQAGFPISIAISDVPCPVPGLDRCNNGNTLSSPTIAVDDTDPNHVYIAWAETSGAGQDIVVADSHNGGINFGSPTIVNGGGGGTRFMPWIGTWGGVAYAGWYDRRFAGASPAAPDDFTRYFYASVSAANGALSAGPESDLMGIDDPQCASGWACGVRSPSDATSCTIQPQLAGFCSITHARCDFNTGCPNSGGQVQTCNTASGCPKYGDYNGLATGGGRLVNIWASGTAPADLPPAANNNIHAYTVVTDLPSNFFVRDWTASATSHDTGVEPSTNPVFYETSDVWNQNTGTPYPPVNDWILGDPVLSGGPNFAFARISRVALAAPTAPGTTVTADFLEADFGLGVPFADIGSQTVTLAGTDSSVITPALAWTVSPAASTHVCLAVQISWPGSPYLPPSLLHGSPGPSGTDPLILQDRQKAQRNLQVTTGGGGGGGEFYALIHNVEKEPRNIELEYSLDPQNARFATRGAITIVGERSMRLEPSGRFVLPHVGPGEERWVGVRFGKIDGPDGAVAIVRFSEVNGGNALNGFAIGVRRVPLPVARRDVLRTEAEVLARLAAITHDSEMQRYGETARSLAGGAPEGIDERRYRDHVSEHLKRLRHAIDALPRDRGRFGRFDLAKALKNLERARDEEAIVTAQQVLLQRLDAQLTYNQRRKRAY